MSTPSKEAVVVAIRALTTHWKPTDAPAQDWWPKNYADQDIDQALMNQIGRLEGMGQEYFPYEVYYGAHDNQRWEVPHLQWVAPTLPDPHTGQPSISVATDRLNQDLQALKEELWGGAPRPSRDDVLQPQGNFCNLRDEDQRVVYTPSLPGAWKAGHLKNWLRIQREAGSTAVWVGPFTPGPAYPGAPFDNPDLTVPAALREFILAVLSEPSASGKGFIPFLMLDGGGPAPETRWGQWAAWGDALADLQESIAVCPAWEPVVGDWTSKQLSEGLGKAKAAFPRSPLAWHGSPTRWVGSSHPLQADDPWQGGEASFYTSHNGEFIEIALYQTQHGADPYEPTTCNCPNWREKDGHLDICALNRVEDGVSRAGAGRNGWRVLPAVVLFETVAFEFFRGQATSEQAQHIAQLAKARVYDKWGVKFFGGNGLP